MNESTEGTFRKGTGALFPTVTAGLVAGTLDITSAFVLSVMKGGTPMKLLQFVASGLIGQQAFSLGWKSAALGMALHFVIAFGATVGFYIASRRVAALTQHAVVSGLAYGVAIYLFMNLIVLPLSAAKIKHSVSGTVTQMIIHMLLIGLPVALIIRRASPTSASSKS